MVRAPESDAEDAICSLLQSKGWREPTIQKLKKLVQPFHSDDPIMRDCYERAIKSGDGIVIYSDPIEDSVEPTLSRRKHRQYAHRAAPPD